MFPSMLGRPEDAWLRDLSHEPLPALVTDLRAIGAAGILVDRAGYDDEGRATLAGLNAELHAEPIASGDGHRLFFRLK
jgi:phosphoglycerol transferase